MTNRSITLRPAHADDMPFLFDLYASTRADELAPLGWSADQQRLFLSQQFRAQQQQYLAHYADASFDMVLCDDRPTGRFAVARGAAIHIIDIALLPAYRNAGIGTWLLNAVLHEGAATGMPVQLHVAKHNPARRWYERLGFRIVDDRSTHWFMEYSLFATPLNTRG